jgi:RNA polymerase sigma-70 factor (ECF subfamily)
LLAEIAGGDVDAFEELYERYQARAYRVARSVCRDEGRAEEAVQDAFMAIWRRPSGYEAGRGDVAAWLLGIARYRAIDAVRGHVRHASRRADEDKLESQRPGDLPDARILTGGAAAGELPAHIPAHLVELASIGG